MLERSLDHYRIEELIGLGAGGQVYRARDPELERLVALKVLRHDPGAREPLREARMQARLEHEHIAQIYETGLHRGRPAVAMQLIEGVDFAVACRSLESDQRLEIFEHVVRAVAFAHRGGLIHRDLKPANVLVEDRGDGRFHAFVVDFGIATEIDAEGVTLTGTIAGTPEYMAPEQIRGERTRRSDLYALGVMLFEAMSGRRPQQAEARLELMFERLRTPAPPLRRVMPEASLDLAAVVDRCLAFEPTHRYASADELLRDVIALRRGEPVSARPLTAAYHAASWLRRHRLLAAVVAGAALAVTVLAGAALRERLRSADRAKLAQDFASSARDLEWTLRAIEMSPIHDATDARRTLSSRIGRVESRLRELGDAAAVPGALALGRAHLALGHPELAREALERGLEAEEDEELRWALGRALAELFRRESLAAIAAVSAGEGAGEADLARRLAALERDLRQPAAELLRAVGPGARKNSHLEERTRSRFGGSGRAEAAAGYGLALLAYLDSDYAAAERWLERSEAGRPWFFEANLLRADIALARAAEEISEVSRDAPEKSAKWRLQADDRLAAALRIAPSSAAALLARCRLGAARLGAAKGRAESREGLTASGRRHCRRLAAVLPEEPSAWAAWSVFEVHAGDLARQTGDPAALAIFERAEEMASSAVWLAQAAQANRADAADLATSHRALGAARARTAVELAERGEDVRPKLRSAVVSLQRAADLGATADRLQALGTALTSLARQSSRRGDDAAALFGRATDVLERAAAIEPGSAELQLKLATAWQNRGLDELDHGVDSQPSLRRAVQAAGRAADLDPRSFSALYRRAVARWHLAEAAAKANRGDADRILESALEDSRRAQRLDPSFTFAVLIEANLAQDLAQLAVDRGQNPRPHWRVALDALDRVERLDAGMAWVAFVRGSVLRSRAVWQIDSSPPDPSDRAAVLEESILPARSEFERGLAINPGEPYAWADLAWTHRLEAEVSEGAAADRAWRRAEETYRRSLEIDDGCAPCFEGLALTLEARAKRRGGSLAAALQAMTQARQLDPASPLLPLKLADLESARCERDRGCDDLMARAERWISQAEDLKAPPRQLSLSRGTLHVVGVERGLASASLQSARSSLDAAVRDRLDLRRRHAAWFDRLEAL
ncbi:MAG: serine/threonine-protein kinase, partial [Acidobacteriota bacterium]